MENKQHIIKIIIMNIAFCLLIISIFEILQPQQPQKQPQKQPQLQQLNTLCAIALLPYFILNEGYYLTTQQNNININIKIAQKQELIKKFEESIHFYSQILITQNLIELGIEQQTKYDEDVIKDVIEARNKAIDYIFKLEQQQKMLQEIKQIMEENK